MKKILKYMIIMILFITIGIFGIHLYTTTSSFSKEQVVKKTDTKEKNEIKEEEQTKEQENQEEINTIEVDYQKKVSVAQEQVGENTEKETTTNVENTKEEENEDTINNTTDLKENTSSSSDTTNENTNTQIEVNIIDLTKNNYEVSIVSEEEPTTNTDTNSTTSTTNTTDVIILEVEENPELDSSNQGNNTSVTSNEEITTEVSSQETTTTTTQETITETTTSKSTSSKTKTKEDPTEVGFDANVDFSKIDNCNKNKVVRTVKGSNGTTTKIHTCISKYRLNNQNSMMQSFAITDEYVYFSNPARGTWVKTESAYQKMGKRAALKQTSANYVTRVNRKTNKYQRIYVEYAGHTQSFDVTNTSNNNQIYMNYFAKLYKGSLGYGARYVGVTAVSFTNNTKKAGVEVIPTTATSISSDGKTFSVLKSASFYTNNTLDTEKYYNKVVSIGSSSNKMSNPEVAVDEEHDRIAFVSGTTAYIYKLSDFQKGKANILKKFTIASGKQGVDLYNGNLYLWTGDKTHILYKYNTSTGNLANKIKFNLNSVYGSNGGGEAEGISVYKGNVYIGISGTIYSDGKKYSDIFLVEGF